MITQAVLAGHWAYRDPRNINLSTSVTRPTVPANCCALYDSLVREQQDPLCLPCHRS